MILLLQVMPRVMSFLRIRTRLGFTEGEVKVFILPLHILELT